MPADHLTPTRWAPIVLAAAALAISGCGSSSHDAASTHVSTAPSHVSTNSYVNSVTNLHTTVENASSRFFHAQRAKLQGYTRSLQSAYESAARQLQTLTPPGVGTAQARELLSAWKGAASDLTTVLSQRPFDPNRAWTVAEQQSEQSERAYGDVLTIP